MAERNSRRIMGIPNEFWIGFVIMCGFFLKVVYVINAGFENTTFQSGMWQEITETAPAGGHLGYIEYLFMFHKLPSVNPSEYACFANPPLYYVFAALLMEFFHRLLNWPAGIALHTIQCINVIFVLVGECCGIGILQKFHVKGRKMVVAILFLLLFPLFYHLSAAMDGSGPAFMFSMLCLNNVLAWYRSRRYQVLRGAAIEFGLGMMCSYMTLLILPALIVIMYYASFDGRRNQTPLKVQFRNFAIITSLMSFWWPIYLSIRWHLPLFYVQMPQGAELHAGIFDRLRIPGPILLGHLHTGGNGALEYNIWAQLFKTAIVDFNAIDISLSGTYMITTFAVYLSLVICLLAHIMLFSLLISSKLERAPRRFLGIGYFAQLIGYVCVCLYYPTTGIMNLRWIASSVIYPLIGLSLIGNSEDSTRAGRVLSWTVSMMILVLSFITAFLFGFYA